jgi:isopenicillin-N N-acyltransferase-like protein
MIELSQTIHRLALENIHFVDSCPAFELRLPPLLNIEGSIPLVHFQGTPQEIGRQQGLLLQPEIIDAVAFYRQRLGRFSDTTLETLCKEYYERIALFSEPLATEIASIAKASGHQLWEIVMIVSRTELLRSAAPQECTALFFPDSGLLGQNWDWAQVNPFIYYVEPSEGSRFLALSEPCLPKIGLNEHGVGVCLTILSCIGKTGGVPVHALLHAILESRSFEEAVSIVECAPTATMSSLLIGDASGRFANFELYPGGAIKLSERELGGSSSAVVHTNGYLSKDSRIQGREESVSSKARFQKASELSQKIAGVCCNEMLGILLNDEGKLPICRQFRMDEQLGVEVGTVCTVVMDLRERELLYTQGNAYDGVPLARVSLNKSGDDCDG